jgi:hypothetical protein
MKQRRLLWQRILERHKFRGRLLRPRVPLVLLRLRRVGHDLKRRTALQPHVTQYALNLHLQLSWPFVSVHGNTLHDTQLHSSSAQNFLWLTPGQSSLHSQTSHYSYSSLRNLCVLCASAVNKQIITAETQRTQRLRREISLFRESRGFVLPQTRKLIQLLQQANTTNSLTHISHNVSHAQNVSNESNTTNKSVEVQEARKIFAGMLLQNSNLATHITSRISSSSTRVDLQREIKDAPKISTRPPGSASTQLKLAAVAEHHRVVKSSKSISSDLTTFHSQRAEHDVLQHTTVFRTQHINSETPISLLHTTVVNAQVLPKERGRATLPDLFLPERERVNKRANQEGRLAPATLYTQPVARNFVTQPAHDETGSQSQVRTIPSASPQINTPTQQQPSLDIGRLTDEVYRHIQRKIRVERERRGL